MQHARSRTRTLASVLLAGSLLLAACGGDDDPDEGGDDTTTEDTEAAEDESTEGDATEDEATESEPADDETAAAGGCPAADPGEGGSINAASIGWTEDVAVNALWTAILADCGYEWTSTPAEVGAIYTGVASGEFDLFMDSWLPNTHEDYWAEFGEDVVDLVTWYDAAPLTWAVPTYVAEEHGITSMTDLAENADLFGGEIIGIESGAGLTRISKESVIPTYGLEDAYTLVESSTAGMLTELESAIADQEPILVTLWEPHSAYAKWDLTNLEDPEVALGEPDEIHTIVRQGFEEDLPQVATWLSNFTISGDELADLELVIEEAGEGNEVEAAASWAADNQDLVSSWFA